MDLTTITSEHVPQGCFLCGSHNAPYLDTQLTDPTIQTADGPVTVKGRVAICIGVPERPGCAVQLGRTAGLIDPERLTVAQENWSISQDRIRELERELAEALASQLRVVSVADLEERLAEQV